MQASRRPAPAGFTLVELLTVIAIIALLIGILVPSLNMARRQARNAKASGQLAALGKGCEMFHADLGRYPRSHGANPFPGAGDGTVGAPLPGAQWLAIQLAGADLRGYVDPDLRNDANADGTIDADDWDAWYQPEADPGRSFPRRGPYVDVTADTLRSFRAWRDEHPQAHVDRMGDMSLGGGRWANSRMPFFVDPFGYPILYYAAEAYAKRPFTTGRRETLALGRYDQSDNAGLTGNEAGQGRNPRRQRGVDPFGNSQRLEGSHFGIVHPLGILGYDADEPNRRPDPEQSFAGFVMDRNVFETGRDRNDPDLGRVWPCNPDAFLLISAGNDGLWGTEDDLTNFQRSR